MKGRRPARPRPEYARVEQVTSQVEQVTSQVEQEASQAAGSSGMAAPSNKTVNTQGRPRKKNKRFHSELVDGDESVGSTES